MKLSLETSQLLKECGFPQDSYFQWIFIHSAVNPEYNHWELLDKEHVLYIKDADIQYACPTSDEILELLPNELGEFYLSITKMNKGTYSVGYYFENSTKQDFGNKSLPEAIAQMYIFLRREKLI